MDIPIEDRNMSLFCLLDVIFTRGHHGLPDFPQDSRINSPSEWDYIYMDKDSPIPYLKFGDIPWSGLERHGYHPRLFQPGSSIMNLKLGRFSLICKLAYRLPDLNTRTDEEREERNRATLFHYDPIKSYGTRARSIYDALNVHWRNGDF